MPQKEQRNRAILLCDLVKDQSLSRAGVVGAERAPFSLGMRR
jgi:hypothetical protein